MEELSGQFEGDIVLNKEQRDYIFGNGANRNGLIAERYRWKNNIVPYVLSENHTKEQQDYIEKGLGILQSISCLKFVRHTDEEDFIELRVRVN